MVYFLSKMVNVRFGKEKKEREHSWYQRSKKNFDLYTFDVYKITKIEMVDAKINNEREIKKNKLLYK